MMGAVAMARITDLNKKWMNEPKYRMTTSTCKNVQHSLALNEADYGRCLDDTNYRQNLVSRRDEQWSHQLSDGHNGNGGTMLPKKSTEQYVRISEVTELPLKGTV